MKLTNHLRSAFVRAAMADVPSINYSEQARERVQAEAIKRLHPMAKVLYNDPRTRGYLHLTCVRLPGEWNYNHRQVMVYAMADYKMSDSMDRAVVALSVLSEAQDQSRSDLEVNLISAAGAVTTRKALVDMLPEFEKYLPADDAAACKTLPAVTNLVASFVQAGWPKGTKKDALTV